MSTADNKSLLRRVNHVELFTRQECETILKTMLDDQSQKGSLTDFKVVPAMENIGFLGEYHHLILDYQLENETGKHTQRLFVKSANASVDKSFYEFYSSISRKEAQLYGLLLNDLKKFSKCDGFSNSVIVYIILSVFYLSATEVWCAKSYFTRDDLFVMQNIEDLGYAPLPAETGFLSEDQLRPMLRALASLHASSVAYERRHRVTIGVQFRKWLLEKSVDPDVAWWTTGIKVSFKFGISIFLHNAHISVFDRLCSQWLQLIRVYDTMPLHRIISQMSFHATWIVFILWQSLRLCIAMCSSIVIPGVETYSIIASVLRMSVVFWSTFSFVLMRRQRLTFIWPAT